MRMKKGGEDTGDAGYAGYAGYAENVEDARSSTRNRQMRFWMFPKQSPSRIAMTPSMAGTSEGGNGVGQRNEMTSARKAQTSVLQE